MTLHSAAFAVAAGRRLALGLGALVLLLAAWAGVARAEEPRPAPDKVVPVGAQSFDILELAVDGNTLLREVDIQNALESFVGPQKTAADVDAARLALESLYRRLGYKSVFVTIPRQTIRGGDGVIVLQVTESTVAQLTVRGSRYTSIDQIKSEVPSLAEGQKPDYEEVQKEIAYANRIPGRKITPVPRAGSVPGTIDVDLNVEDQLPLRLSSEVNNRHSKGTTDNRVVASAGYDNLFQLGHSLSFTYQTAPQRIKDGQVFYGSYLARLGDGSWNLMGSALRTTSNVAAFSGVDVLGSGRSYGLRLTKQLPDVDGSLYPSVFAGFDYKNFNTQTRVEGTETPTPARYMPFAIGYSQLLRLPSQSLQNDVSLSFASPQIGSDSSTLDLGRLRARGQQLYLRLSADYSHDLPLGMEGGVHFSGQLSDQPLISSEQFSAGGMDSVRGYLEAEALGDYGYIAGAELRAPSLFELLPARWSWVFNTFRPLVFFDAANLRLRGPYPDSSTPHSFFLTSTGAGLSFRLVDHLSGTLNWALPLQPGPSTGKHDSRLLFRISASL
jgi:hemolysin activation/secretion protein